MTRFLACSLFLIIASLPDGEALASAVAVGDNGGSQQEYFSSAFNEDTFDNGCLASTFHFSPVKQLSSISKTEVLLSDPLFSPLIPPIRAPPL